MIYAKEVRPMRARRLLFPCASVAFPRSAFFWTSQPPTVELPWMRWAFLASAALLLLNCAPRWASSSSTRGGARAHAFQGAFIPWQDVRQVGKHEGLVAIPKNPAQNIFISRVRQPWAKDKYLPRLYRCFWRRKDGRYTRKYSTSKVRPRWKRPSAAIGQGSGSTCCPKLVSAGESLRRSSFTKGDVRGRSASGRKQRPSRM